MHREGFPPLSNAFSTKAGAAAWARGKERAIDRAERPADIRDFKGLTLAVGVMQEIIGLAAAPDRHDERVGSGPGNTPVSVVRNAAGRVSVG